MRDFRDAKDMARALRDALKAKAIEITHAEALELIAKAFGVTDWNALAAAIRREASTPREDTLEQIARAFGVADWNMLAAAIRREASSPRDDASSHRSSRPASPRRYCRELKLTLHRTLGHADQRNHEYATLEHLLFALIDDADASAVMKACKADLGPLKESVANYIDNELETLVTEDDREPTPTAGFQRVVQRAVRSAEALAREATGADLLVAMFNERESPAVWLLGEQEITHYDAVSFINRRIL
jgi:transcriptional regulator with XRE-family HTH domain